jgi:glutaredoxin 3
VPRELYGTRSCPFTAELREQLAWDDEPFEEYDVERDRDALARLSALVGVPARVPVLVDDGRVELIGWHGRCCYVAVPP